MKTLNKIMVVDDDTDDIFLFKEVLSYLDSHLEFSSAEDGKEALDILKESGEPLPDVVFLDLNMPRMDGKECLKKMKMDDDLRDIPVFIYTTSSQVNDIEEAMEAGAYCFITKPNDLKELERILHTVINTFSSDLDTNLRNLSKETHTLIHC